MSIKGKVYNSTGVTKIGESATDVIAFHGVAGADQAAHIATPTDLATSITAITAILVALEELGIVASS